MPGRLHARSLAVAMITIAIGCTTAAVPSSADAAGSQRSAALTAAVDLAREATAVDALGGFGTSAFNPLADALRSLPLVTGADHAGLLRQLDAADRAGATQLRVLQAGGGELGREVEQVLPALSPADRAAAAGGRTISISPRIYLAALDDLAVRDGAPPTSAAPPQPPEIRDALAAALNGTSSPTVPSSTPTGGTNNLLLVGIIVGIVLAAGVGAMWFIRRRPAQSHAPPMTATLTTPSASVHGVLEATRRLTAGTVGEDIHRAIVREMLGLVPGRAGALLVDVDSSLDIAHETSPGLLTPSGFTRGLVAEATRTGSVATGSSAGDGSFARGDLQVALAPLVAHNDVIGVMAVLRDAGSVFAAGERQMLASLAPVAAAALQSAARTQAAFDASLVDPLTGVGNRRGLDAHLPTVLASTAGNSTGFVMVDLDHFKSVNDTFGHPAGDALLRGVCAVIRDTIRPTDAVYRYGGEEFCLVLPATSAQESEEIADRVRTAIATTAFDVGDGRSLAVTASLGVAVSDGADPQNLVARADAALYEAKRSGRDRVCTG